jgi:hypothetical protein
MTSQQTYLQEMVSAMLSWNQFDIYYLAKRLCIPHMMLCRALRGQTIPSDCSYRILCYYLAHHLTACVDHRGT